MTERPTGTVTFLFTDIEGSTRLWEHHAPVMDPAHRRQEALIRQAILAHDGYPYKMIGDAFQAAFQAAPAALAAAVAAQRALAAEPWPTPTPLRVRMALHTGATEERADDYVGPLLNRVARLMAAGHGGQILLTQTTYELVRDDLPDGVTLRDLGERRLKDLIRPEHVWQVLAAGLPAEFPPLQTLDSRSNNLPRQPTALIGREPEAAAVAARLRRPDTALLTLTGPGGTGKTRLALQVAADLLDEFPDGCWFVELAALTDPGLVPSTIAQTLGVKEQGTTPILDTLKDWLKDRRLLLVLDNCEQVADAADDIAALLPTAPHLKVLVTSRIALDLYGEQVYAVPPLPVPDPQQLPPLAQVTQYGAVRLFIDRALARDPVFAVTTATAPAVAAICWHLDGLPLAIELAAARTSELTVEEIRAQLDDKLGLLVGRLRGRVARQQTMRGAIDWSYHLLSAEEQQLFRRLAVFQGGRTVEALQAVCNADGQLALDVPAGVERLVSQSLLQPLAGRNGEPRFGLLETIHEYAREKLGESGEGEALSRAHLAYFVQLAEQAEPELNGPRQREWLDRLEDDYDNLRAALGGATRPDSDPAARTAGLRLGGALWRFWWVRGHWSEGRTLLTALLAADGPGGEPERVKALNGAGVLAALEGDVGAARILFEESLALARALGDQRSIIAAINNLGIVAREQGDYEAARTRHQEVLALRRALGDQAGIAGSLGDLGQVAYAQGDYGVARILLEEALALRRPLGDQQGIAITLGNLGLVAWEQGDYSAARTRHQESLALFQALGDQGGIAGSLSCLGLVAQAQGDYGAAQALFVESLALRRALGDQGGLVACLAGLGGARAGQAAGARAAQVLGATAALLTQFGAALERVDREPYERAVAATRAALGDAAFDQAWAAGQALSLDDAITLALAEDETSLDPAV